MSEARTEEKKAEDSPKTVSTVSWNLVDEEPMITESNDKSSFMKRPWFMVLVALVAISCGSFWQWRLEAEECSSVDVLKKDAMFKCSMGWFKDLMECDKLALRSHLRSQNATIMNEAGFDSCLNDWRARGYVYEELGKADWLHGYPLDCEGTWSDWGGCSTSCGGGRHCSYFSIKQHSRHGGRECDHVDGGQNCSVCKPEQCPRDCHLGAWELEPCSELCGGGTQRQHREVISESQFGGFCPLPDSTERVRTIPCNTHQCPDAVLQEIGEAVSMGTAIQEGTQQSEALQKTKHHLLDHLPIVDCTAGMASEQASASCSQHNAIASKTVDLALKLETGHDECERAAAQFRVLLDALKHNLPHMVKQICAGDREGAESTFSGLVEPEVDATVEQFDKCLKPYREFGLDLVPMKSGLRSLHFDAKSREDAVLHKIKKETADKNGVLQDISNLAEEMSVTSRQRDDAYQAQQAKEQELRSYRESSAKSLGAKQELAHAAGTRARRGQLIFLKFWNFFESICRPVIM